MNNTIFKKTGIGLRSAHYADILQTRPDVGFLEVHSENYFRIGGVPFEQLMQCRAHYPISLHGVGLSLGTATGVSDDHLKKLKALVDLVDPVFVSEHLSWSGVAGVAVPDLLPMPMTEEALSCVCDNVDKVQNVLGRKILVENPSSYLVFKNVEIDEPDFLAALVKRSGCGLILDVNNIHVSGHNAGFDPYAYLKKIPKNIVTEIHLAGYQVNEMEEGVLFIDTHDQPVYDPVWLLYDAAIAQLGDISTLIEWDANVPALNILLAEAEKANKIREKYNGVLKETGTHDAA